MSEIYKFTRGFGPTTLGNFLAGDKLDFSAFGVSRFEDISEFIGFFSGNSTITTFYNGVNEVLTVNNYKLGPSDFIFNLSNGGLTTIGTSNADVLFGGKLNDYLTGGEGDDLLIGGEGTDVFYIGGDSSGFDTFRGGPNHPSFGDRVVIMSDTSINKMKIDAASDIEELWLWDDGQHILSGTSKADLIDISGIRTIINKVPIHLESGDDIFFGGGSSNEVYGEDGDDKITGSSSDDLLIGGVGNDTLDGKDGWDVFLIGGNNTGNDIFKGGEGHDIVRLTENTSLTQLVLDQTASVETLQLLSFSLSGTSGADTFDLSGTLAFVDVSRPIDLGAGSDNFKGSVGADYVLGGTGDDVLDGGPGNDIFLIGGSSNGFDTFRGGGTAGNTDYDRVMLLTDVSVSKLILNAAAGIEELSLWYSGEGQPSRTLAGTIGDDLFDLTGIQVIGRPSPIDMRAGNDRYDGHAERDVVLGSDGTDTLLGFGGNDSLDGGIGDDLLDGGAGVDKLDGGAGNDTYVVDSASDVIVETAGNGTADRVMARASYTLAAGADVERMQTVSSTATTAINLTGNALAQEITGNYGNNVLRDGPAGGAADVLKGLNGNDTYQVYNSGTTITESASVAGGTADRVMAGVDYVLASGVGVEIMTTNGASGTGGIDLAGNALKQAITGNAGANILKDGGGAGDTLTGLAGNDTYIVGSIDTQIVEVAGQGTADKVAASVDFVIGAGVHVEQMTTTSSAGTSGIDLTGNAVAQQIVGNAGSNILDGKGGNDTLKGLGAKDFFVFSSTLGTSNVDTIADFSVADDTIRLENSIFTALTTTGTLAASRFKDNALAPRDADDLIIYNSNTGSLFYDGDGLGGAAAVKFASLTGAPTITAADFVVI